ncbi:GNAT family N-acetyltransferase [Kitasatospora sp. NPDC050543]|uniref:GNAT family N-acetyltransferase n=1 Tax=Kitasatospora sp. NPDC050543 TaxID=3364054 RepID=UPI00378C105A
MTPPTAPEPTVSVPKAPVPKAPVPTSVPLPAGRPRWTVDTPSGDDFEAWRELYREYAQFYRLPMPDEQSALVWAWIRDATHELEALLVRDTGGTPVGLAHYRPFARPLHGAVGGYLDDLFVPPAARGGGAVDVLLARLRAIAAERG